MPYIKQELRSDLKTITSVPINAGELNYFITHSLIQYSITKGLSYQTINDIIGALEGAKLEFYARIARPYEDLKIKENGDAY